MAIGERIKIGAVVFGNWEVDGKSLGNGSNGKTIVYRLKRGQGESVEYQAQKDYILSVDLTDFSYELQGSVAES